MFASGGAAPAPGSGQHMAAQPISLKGRALRLLGAREYARAELGRKLAPHAESAGQIDSLLDELEAKGFLSEQRAAESVVHRRAPRLGSARIRQELRAKGLAPELIEQSLAGLQSSEVARARQIWNRKFSTQPVSGDPAARARQMRFLLARGFSADVVRCVVLGGEDDGMPLPE